jgi:hypothetical protein
MSPHLEDLFLVHAVASFDKQLFLGELVNDANWQFSLSDCRLSFSDERSWSVQILGTESEIDGAWKWSWSNPSPGVPVSAAGKRPFSPHAGRSAANPGIDRARDCLGGN